MTKLLQRYSSLIFQVMWIASTLLFLSILFLAIWGGPASTREIRSSRIVVHKSETSNPASGSYPIPDMGIKPLLFGGLVSPAQVSVLENHSPLPSALCSLGKFELDHHNCYAIHIGRVYFSSSDGSHLRENGKQYEITWRWKPGPGLILVSLLLFFVFSIVAGKKYPGMGQQRLLQAQGWLADQPTEVWVIVGFLVSFILFSFIPTFLNTQGFMAQGLVNVPTAMQVGSDHEVIVEAMVRDFFYTEPKYVIRAFPYPPFTLLFHALFLPFDSVGSYRVISLMTFAAFVLAGFIIPMQFNPQKKQTLLALFFFITGLFSYGFQFEIERGQFNLIAVSLAVASIFIFHQRPKLRWLSYLLFTMSVQLKLYPLIFILGLIDNWQDWIGIFKRFVLLGFMNFAALFVLGFKNFSTYLHVINNYATAGSGSWIGGHSIKVFVSLLPETIISQPSSFDWAWLNTLSTVLTLITLLCFAILVFCAYKQNLPGPNAALLLGCAVVAQLLPSVSFDYTLSMLPIVLALFFSDIQKIDKGPAASILLLVLGSAYGNLLFSFTQKSIVAAMLFLNPTMIMVMMSAFPALFLLLITATGFSVSKTIAMQGNSQH